MSSPTPGASPAPTSPPPPEANNTTPPPPTTPAPPVASPPPPKTPSDSPSPPLSISPPANGSGLPVRPPSGPPNNTLIALGVGVGIGGLIVLVAVGILVFWYMKRRRNSTQGWAYTSGPPPPGPKDGPVQHWQQNAPLLTDNLVAMLPKPSPPPGVASNPQPSPVRVPTLPPLPSTSISSGSEKPYPPPSPGIALGFSKIAFTYEELAMATDGFSNANLLGQGGFGYVHKGVLPNGRVVAIKQLKAGSRQGEREFQAEVEIISRVHHKHLVSLVGYCITGAQRMLVYEFVPNNTMEFHLHGKERPPMNWEMRMKIALGSAKGLAYLHEDCQPKIIHRDIKASNILLAYNFEAKVADFGLAKFFSDTDTHISTRVMGTFGYLAPEYASSGKLTDKSDVFSFGVVLLELITGRRPVDRAQPFLDDSMVEWARPLLTQALEDDNFDTLVDPRLQRDCNSSEMARMVACAAVCVRHSARHRPRMSQIVRALEGNISLDDLNEGIRPGQSAVYESSDYDSNQYSEDMKKFRKMALESQEQNTSDFSGPTSEYGLHPSGSSSEAQHYPRDGNGGNEEKH